MNTILFTIGLIFIIIAWLIRSRQFSFSTTGVEEKQIKLFKYQNDLLANYCFVLGVISLVFSLLAYLTDWIVWFWLIIIIILTIIFMILIQKNT